LRTDLILPHKTKTPRRRANAPGPDREETAAMPEPSKKNSTRGRGTTVVSISLNDVELERLAAHCRATGLGRSGTIAVLLFRSTPRPRKRAK
jgi:hypothetical protein